MYITSAFLYYYLTISYIVKIRKMLPPRPPKSVNGLRANKKNNLISNRMIKLTEKLSTN